MEQFGTLEVIQIVLAGLYCIALWFYLDKAL
jgi:hypothetical protein